MSEHEMVEEDVDETSSSSDQRDREAGAGGSRRPNETVEAAEAAVQDDLAVLTAERDEMRALAQRLQADFENYKKRMLREQTNAIEQANARLLEQMLPVLESFELAAKSIESTGESSGADVDKLRGGVLAAIRQLEDVVGKAGLEPIDATGQPFDPNEHEAVMQDDGDGEPVVAQVLRTGYRMKGRVLRPAMVRVTRNHFDAQA